MTADTGADDEDVAASDAATPDGESGNPDIDPEDVAAIAAALENLDGDVSELADDLDDLETRIDEKTVHRDDIRSELRRYVRKRQRRGHATGWGPYLVLLYGTAMTVAAFFYLGDLWAVVAMLVIWLSTLGLYVFMLVIGAFLGVGRRVAGLRDLAGKFR